eukprot:TRINITY_DN14482_c0_g1_i1.p1 TRINITY_DN14482_c0_g1~~TRINITY_DN14482_c0_g1_i1.p1  ORF type:complete len:349 (-),score=117.68 TRINITY_DN14482_c0_g1_i1:43-1089(-)
MTALGIRTGGLTTQSFAWLAKKHHLTENEVRDLDARYKAADLDRSGQLDRQELTAFLKTTIAAKATEAGLEKFLTSQWHNVDRDGNGTVDFDEFLGLYAVLKAHPNQAAEKQAAAAAPAAKTAAAPKAAAAAPAGSGSSRSRGLGVSRRERRKTSKAARKASGKKRAARPATSFPTNPALNQQNYISQDIVWATIRKQNAFLVTRPNGRYGDIKLTRERGNLTNTHSQKHSGLIHGRTVDITPTAGGIRLRLNATSERRRNQPRRQYTSTKLVSDNRQLSGAISRQLQNYRRTAIPAALARASKLRYASAHGAAPTSKRAARAARQAAAVNTANTTTTAAAAPSTSAQ